MHFFAQNLKFGYPKEIEPKDLILLGMFKHRDGQFIDETEINESAAFLKNNNGKKFKIKIHLFGVLQRERFHISGA